MVLQAVSLARWTLALCVTRAMSDFAAGATKVAGGASSRAAVTRAGAGRRGRVGDDEERR